MKANIKLFGPQAQTAGKREVTLNLPGEPTTVARVRQALRDAEPSLAPTLEASRFAVNHEFAGEDQPVHPGDEVALIGSVSGG